MGSDISTSSSKENKVINKLGSANDQSKSIVTSFSQVSGDTFPSLKSFDSSTLRPSSSQLPQEKTKSSANIKQNLFKEVIVVNQAQESDNPPSQYYFNFDLLFKPLTPIGHETLSPRFPSLDSFLLIDLGLTLENFLKSKSDLVNKEQSKIFDLIREADLNCNCLSSVFFIERLKKITKIVENLEKLEETEKLFQKCENAMDDCLNKIDKLNNCYGLIFYKKN